MGPVRCELRIMNRIAALQTAKAHDTTRHVLRLLQRAAIVTFPLFSRGAVKPQDRITGASLHSSEIARGRYGAKEDASALETFRAQFCEHLGRDKRCVANERRTHITQQMKERLDQFVFRPALAAGHA
jgi:hypothetical protein